MRLSAAALAVGSAAGFVIYTAEDGCMMRSAGIDLSRLRADVSYV
jgi:hypothetical protein